MHYYIRHIEAHTEKEGKEMNAWPLGHFACLSMWILRPIQPKIYLFFWRGNTFVLHLCWPAIFYLNMNSFYRTRVRSLGMLVTNWLTDWLTNSLPFSKLDWCGPGVPTQNLLRLLMLLMLMLRIILATACWFGSWPLVIKLNFCSDFEHKGWSRFWNLKFRQDFDAGITQHFDADVL